MPEWNAALASRLAALRLSPTREREIVEELSQHLDDVYREHRAGGASEEEAVRLALEELEDHELLATRMQPLRQASSPAVPPPPGLPGGRWLPDVAHDIRFAVRTLLHSPAWSLVIVLLLALGIGANTALFSATDALLFSPLPVEKPDQLVRFQWTGRNDAVNEHLEYGFTRRGPAGQRVWASFSHDVYRQLASDAAPMAELFASAPLSRVNAVIDGQAEFAEGFAATGNYFGLLGVRAARGRVFTPADDRADAPPVCVISWPYWVSRFGADPSAVGKAIKVNDVPVTIVGVLPRTFVGVQQTIAESPDLVVPLVLDRQMRASSGRSGPSLLEQQTSWWLQMMGRLKPGASAARLQASLEGVFQQTTRAGLDSYLQSLTQEERGTAENRDRREVPRLLVEPGARGLYDVDDDAKASATILGVVVAIILLIICANVANLMLSRAIVRQKEIAVRLSLGATRGRLVRQLLTEALVLATTGATLGLLVAYWGVRLLPEPASSVSVFHGRTYVFAALAAVLTSLVFGALPALRATRVDVNTRLKETGRGVGARRGVLGRSLLVVQVALSLMLLVGAGLFLQTVNHLRRVDAGFDTQNLLLVRLTPGAGGYDQPRTQDLYKTLLERFAGIPGVRGAALSQPALLSGSVSSTRIYREGQPVPKDRSADDEEGRSINVLVVSPGFFQVMGIPVTRGRAFTDTDTATAPRVALINETAARTYFPGQDPVGKRFGQSPDRASVFEVVGIVKDAKYSSLREPVPPTMYLSYVQSPRALASFELRTAGTPLSIANAARDVVRQVDPNLPVADVTTQVEQIERRFAQEKLFAQAYVLFGSIALLLAAVGLFGLMSYSVARRTSEMGVRMALGARRPDVVRLVMRESLWLAAIGVVAGLLLAALSARYISSLLYGVPPHHPWTMLAAAGVMIAVSAVAAYLPARRASLVDPMVALRYE